MRVSVVVDSVDPARLAAFWVQALDYRIAAELPRYVVLVAKHPGPGTPVLVLQQVPEVKAGKNRVHLDLHPADVEQAADRLEALGATRLGQRVTELEGSAGITWQVMADPEGNEFCLVADGT